MKVLKVRERITLEAIESEVRELGESSLCSCGFSVKEVTE